MDDDVRERLDRARPAPVSDDPAVADPVRQLVSDAARVGRHRTRRTERIRLLAGMGVAAAVCTAVVPLLSYHPAREPDAAAVDPARPVASPEVRPERALPASGEDSAAGSTCVVRSDVVPQPGAATDDVERADRLTAARRFLVEHKRDAVPLDAFLADTFVSTEAHTAAEVEARSVTELEAALDAAGYLTPGIDVVSVLVCERPAVP